MKNSKHAVHFLYRDYLVSHRYLMPVIATSVFLWVLYAVSPHSIVDSYTISMVFLFLLMVWVSISYHETQNTIVEQITVLKLKKPVKTYLLQCAFLLLISLIMSLLLVLTPTVGSFIQSLYKRPITMADVIISILLHSLAGYVGSALGGILHPRIVNNRVVTIFVAMVASLLCIIKPGLHTMLPFTKYITWLFPPVAEFCTRFANQSIFIAKDVIITVIQLLVYGTILTSMKVALLVRNKF